MAQPNSYGILPRDGRGEPIPTGSHADTGVVTSGTGTGTDDVTLPKGALEIVFWATAAFDFLGVGAASGTQITCLANQVYSIGCAGTDGTWKAYFNTSGGSSTSINYYIVMGAENA